MPKHRLQTPLSYYGAKMVLAPKLASAMPRGRKYAEVFAGGGAVFHELPPFYVHSYLSDLNPWPIAALRAIRDEPERLLDELPMEIDEPRWLAAVESVKEGALTGDAVKDAVTMIVAWKASFNYSPWSNSFSKRGREMYSQTIRNGALAARVLASHNRLQGVEIEVADAICQINRVAAPGVVFFCDPPYMWQSEGGGSRKAPYGGYGPWEPSVHAWHGQLLDAIESGVGKGASFLLTTGDDDLYVQRLTELRFDRLDDFVGGAGNSRGKSRHLIWRKEARDADR